MNKALEYALVRLCDREREENARKALRKCVTRLLTRYWEQFGREVPLDIEKIAHLAGVKFICKSPGQPSDDINWEKPHGVLVPEASSLSIKVLGHQSDNGVRAAIAHEVGHTFFYDRSIGRAARPLGLPPGPMEEDLCELAGRELLLPAVLFVDEWVNMAVKTDLAGQVIWMAKRFLVSPFLVAKRLQDDGYDKSSLPRVKAVGLWRFGKQVSALNVGIIAELEPRWLVFDESVDTMRVIKATFIRAARATAMKKTTSKTDQAKWTVSAAIYGVSSRQVLGVLAQR